MKTIVYKTCARAQTKERKLDVRMNSAVDLLEWSKREIMLKFEQIAKVWFYVYDI